MPLRFAFRLERLLELRKHQVEETQKLLARCIENVRAADAILIRLHEEQKKLNQSWHLIASRALNADCAMDYQLWMENLLKSVETEKIALENVKKEEMACRSLLTKAMGRKKSLEKLRERALGRFVQESNRRSQAELDDFTGMRQKQGEA